MLDGVAKYEGDIYRCARRFIVPQRLEPLFHNVLSYYGRGPLKPEIRECTG